MKRNIGIDYIYRFLSSFDITAAIWVLFLAYKGMTLIEIGLLESIYHSCNLIFEIPTGAMADLLGRKKMIILSRLAAMISSIVLLVSQSFVGFAIGFIFSAFSGNLNSGSEEALVYDSFISIDQTEEYLTFNSRLNVLIEVAQALAVFIGGLLAEVSFELSYLIAILIAIGALSVALQFKEPMIHETQERSSVKDHFQQCFIMMKLNRRLLAMLLYFPLMMTFTTVIYFYAQAYFSDFSYSKSTISLIFLVNGLVSALGALLAEKVERWCQGKAWLFVPLSMSVMICIFGYVEAKVGIFVFCLINFLSAILYPISSVYMNEETPSEKRATIISVSSMMFSLMMILIFPLCGWLGERVGLAQAFQVIGLLNLLIVGTIALIRK